MIFSSKCSSQFIKNLKTKFNKSVFIQEKIKLNKFSALNQGIELGRSDNIGILHADDYYEDKKLLKNVVNLLTDHDFVFCGVKIINDSNQKLIRIWKPKEINLKSLLFPPHTGLFHKRNIEGMNIKYNLNFPISSDFDFILRLLNQTYNYKVLKNFYIVMSFGGDSTNIKNLLKTLKEDWLIFKKNNFSFPLLKAILKKIYKINQFFIKI